MSDTTKVKPHVCLFVTCLVDLITGPSRTRDIQQTLLLGIHGPQRLLINIVDEKNP